MEDPKKEALSKYEQAVRELVRASARKGVSSGGAQRAEAWVEACRSEYMNLIRTEES